MKKTYNPQAIYKLLKGKAEDGTLLLSEILTNDMYCTENIQWRELLLRQTQLPAIEVLENLYAVANRLQAFRDTIFQNNPITITSAWRSEKYNKQIGGEDNSFHCKGMAIDFQVKNIMPSHVQDLLFHHSGGLGKYRLFSHIDTANKRRWNG